MAAPGPAERSRPTLLILLAAALTLLTLQVRGAEPLDAFQQGIRDIIGPVRTVVDKATDPIQSVWSGIVHYGELEEENERLAKELAEVRGEVLSEEADRELLERLLGEIDVPYADLETVVARILGTPPGNFGSHLVEIDKGSDDGLSDGMAVVTGAGLVGRLEQVDRQRSVVILATHPDFSVGVRLVESQDEGLAIGTGGDEMRLEDGVRLDAVIAEDEVVITSGGRSRFPADIPVGKVTDPDNFAEYERTIKIELAASLENLSFVNVVMDLEENS